MTPETNRRLLRLNLSHSIIPRSCMDWNQWLWYTGANESSSTTITQKYMKDKPDPVDHQNEDESWNLSVKLSYAVGVFFIIMLMVSSLAIYAILTYAQNETIFIR